MAHILHLKQTYRRTRSGVVATIRAIVRAAASEHTLALRAAARAASPRQSLADVRAMYLPAQQEGSDAAPGTSSVPPCCDLDRKPGRLPAR